MSFLADMGVSRATVLALRELGEEIVHLRDEGLHRLPDPEILAKGRAEGRIVITFDLDFGDLLAWSGDREPSVIIIRTRNQTPAYVTPRLVVAIGECRAALEAGAVITVEENGYRVRRLPIAS